MVQRPARSTLRITRDEATDRIFASIERGRVIRELTIITEDELQAAYSEYYKWTTYNEYLLVELFDDQNEYERYHTAIRRSTAYNATISAKAQLFRRDVDIKLRVLETIIERMPMYQIRTHQNISNPQTRQIFVVHGHDEGAKYGVTRFLEKLDLEPILLDEVPNAGRTIIEKLEKYSEGGFAVVLLTPDDVGTPRLQANQEQLRARQNVIFELILQRDFEA